MSEPDTTPGKAFGMVIEPIIYDSKLMEAPVPQEPVKQEKPDGERQ